MARTSLEFLRDFVDKSRGPDACWPYLGARNKAGYGYIGGTDWHGLAHRLMLELKLGHPVGALLACHHCDNPPCVNPAHLYAGTAKDNAADKIKRKRGKGARSPMIDELPPACQRRKHGEPPHVTPVEIATALERAIADLRTNPDDIEGWDAIVVTLQRATDAARKHRLARFERAGATPPRRRSIFDPPKRAVFGKKQAVKFFRLHVAAG